MNQTSPPTHPQGYRRPARLLRVAPWGTVALVALALALTFGDYGLTWDEKVQSTYGELALDYFASKGQNQEANRYLNLRYYGPLFEMGCAAIYRTTGWDRFLVRHGCTALAAVFGLIGLIVMARQWRCSLVPLFAVVALATLPRWYGHAVFNSKDIPFATAFTWAMAAIGWLLTTRHRTWRHYLLCGLAIGLALALRVGALLLFCFLAAGTGGALLQRCGLRRDAWRQAFTPRHLGMAAALIAVAWATMVISWPWAHQSPIRHPFVAFRAAADFEMTLPVRYEGAIVASHELPRHYLPTMLAIVTPVGHLLLIAGGLLAVLLTIRRDWRGPRALLGGLLLLWALFPPAYVVATHANIYDGIRHFLFVLPALALLAAIGGDWWRRRCRRRFRPAAGLAVLIMLLLPLPRLISLHPYQMTYYNAFAGGTARATRLNEGDYWSSSYKEAIEWIDADARRRNLKEAAHVMVIASPNNLLCASHYATDRLALHPFWTGLEPPPPRIDYAVALNRQQLPHLLNDLLRGRYPLVHTVGRDGAVFTYIYARPTLPEAGDTPGAGVY